MDQLTSNPSERLKSFFGFSSDFLRAGMSREDREVYEFEGYRLDVDERTFTRIDGVKNGNLPEKAFQTLTVLVRNHGRLVTKQELLDAVWPDSFVEENNLDKCIHAIRHSVGESANDQKFVETVRKHGYRFIADVRQVGPAEPISTPDRVEESAPAKRRPHLLVVAMGAVAIAAGIFLLSSWMTRAPAGSPKTIFILPVQSIGSADRRDEMLELGIADAIITRLASAEGLIVRSMSATREFAGSPREPVEAGKRQNVDYVLESNYQIDGGKIRVTSQLFNVATGAAEDSFKGDFDFQSMFGAQDAVGAEIAGRIVRKLNGRETAAGKDRGTSNEQAYRRYLEGMYHYDMRSREGAEKAVAALTGAVELDPNYARAWAGKAHAHLAAAGFGRDSDLHGHNKSAIDAIQKALSLDKGQADAYSALCIRTITYDYDPAAAEPNCKKAIELSPNSGIAHQVYSRFLNSAGRHDEAVAEIKIAVDLEPASVFNHRLLGIAYHYARRYDEAAAQHKRVIAMERSGPTFGWLAMTLGLAGKDAEAFEVWMQYRPNISDDERRASQAAFAKEGWKGIVRLRARQFEKSNEVFFHGAAYHAYIGEADQAFAYLNESLSRREHNLPYLRVDPRFDPIREDPRYGAFLARAGL